MPELFEVIKLISFFGLMFCVLIFIGHIATAYLDDDE
tara:strand:+ start:72704 stop:72814 length:111 start_codon:yes stop_codon:yes gene_type:complete